jgi:Archaeal fructose-1,6-bisphosphatase and related enzymes of inositol monophosphatase family
VSAALVEDGSPALAAVFAPASDEFFSAARGHRATLNDGPVHATAGTELDFSRVAGPNRWCSGSVRHPVKSSFIRESDRWRFGCAGSRKEAWIRLLRAAKAAIGTLPRPI